MPLFRIISHYVLIRSVKRNLISCEYASILIYIILYYYVVIVEIRVFSRISHLLSAILKKAEKATKKLQADRPDVTSVLSDAAHLSACSDDLPLATPQK